MAVKTGAQTRFTGKDHSGKKAGQDVPGKHVAQETSQREESIAGSKEESFRTARLGGGGGGGAARV